MKLKNARARADRAAENVDLSTSLPELLDIIDQHAQIVGRLEYQSRWGWTVEDRLGASADKVAQAKRDILSTFRAEKELLLATLVLRTAELEAELAAAKAEGQP